MLTTVYGWQEGLNTPVGGTNNDDYALATQIIIWEYQQQLRTSPTRIVENNGIPADHYVKTIQGDRLRSATTGFWSSVQSIL